MGIRKGDFILNILGLLRWGSTVWLGQNCSIEISKSFGTTDRGETLFQEEVNILIFPVNELFSCSLEYVVPDFSVNEFFSLCKKKKREVNIEKKWRGILLRKMGQTKK